MAVMKNSRVEWSAKGEPFQSGKSPTVVGFLMSPKPPAGLLPGVP